jgi:flagellar biosynthesis/type III secretory pathway ATPase
MVTAARICIFACAGVGYSMILTVLVPQFRTKSVTIMA